MNKAVKPSPWLVTVGTFLKNRLAAKALLLSSIFISLLIVVWSQEQESRVQAKPEAEIITLSKENQKVFIRNMVSDYLLTTDQLQQNFSEFENTGDAYGFIEYRNQDWTPDYLEKKVFYQKILHRNKAYVYRHQLESLFQCYDELQNLALHLKHSLLDKDIALQKAALERLQQDRQKVTALLRVP